MKGADPHFVLLDEIPSGLTYGDLMRMRTALREIEFEDYKRKLEAFLDYRAALIAKLSSQSPSRTPSPLPESSP